MMVCVVVGVLREKKIIIWHIKQNLSNRLAVLDLAVNTVDCFMLFSGL